MKLSIRKLGMSTDMRRVVVIMVVSAIIYYLPTILGCFGWMSSGQSLFILHDFYGMDFFALVFFAPVVYAAYAFGVKGGGITALICMLLLFPYALMLASSNPTALFRPTAFAIILSAVGAVIAMLQGSDEQRQRSMNELKCLYDMGKAAEGSDSVEVFLSSVVRLMPQTMRYNGGVEVKVSARGKTFESQGFKESAANIREYLPVGGEMLGTIEIYSDRDSSYLDKKETLIKTIAERIGSAIREIELQNSLKDYYEQLEEIVEKRTRELEQAQEKLIRSERLAAVGELASGVGHELRNPLNVIKNCAYLLNLTIGDSNDEETRNTLRLVEQQVEISNRIVTDLLDFTRVRRPSRSSIELDTLVKESLSWVAVPENVTVKENLDAKSSPVNVDAEQVGRSFANIISNGIQAISGEGELGISSGVNGKYAWVKFEDSGCGISAENMEKIFEPLFTTKSKGIGLGLAITRRLIEQNKGKVEVESQMGRGTTFTVRLPLKKSDTNENEDMKKEDMGYEKTGKHTGS